MSQNASGAPRSTDVERELRRVLYETGVITTNHDELVPIEPREALEEYLAANPEENLPSTMRSHKSRLTQFVDWCTEVAEHNTLQALTGDDLEAFKQYQVDAGYAPRTLESQLETIGVFLRFSRQQNYVGSDLPYLIPDIRVAADDEVRDRLLDRERAVAIVDHLARFQYASREHVVLLLLVETGIRLCTLRALDRQDYFPPSADDAGYLDLVNRPESGTRLKNGRQSEREVALPPAVCGTLDDYLAYTRVETTDEHGRQPLITTASGRIAGPTIRSYVNKWTAPCMLNTQCPHGRAPETCMAAQKSGNMDCPSKRSPHDVRRGYITYLRKRGVPKEIISDEVDASVAVLDKHYDKTTKAEQRQMRTAALKAVLDASEEEL